MAYQYRHNRQFFHYWPFQFEYELSDREYVPRIDPNKARIQIEMVNNEKIEGYVFIDMPQIKSRASDYFNIFRQFVCIYKHQSDLILNKAFNLSVKEITM